MPWLYHKYAGHDINRDAFMMNLAENRNLARVLLQHWHPQVFLTMHQMEDERAALLRAAQHRSDRSQLRSARSGARRRCSAARWPWSCSATGTSGSCTNAMYDYYWPGYEDSAPLGHNTVCLLTEVGQRRHRVAGDRPGRPSSAAGCKGLAGLPAADQFPGPVAGRPLDAARHRRLRPERRARPAVRRGALPRANWSRTSTTWGAAPSRRAGKADRSRSSFRPSSTIRTRRPSSKRCCSPAPSRFSDAMEPFRADGEPYPAGTDIVFMAQPYRAYVKTLLERQSYPARRAGPNGAAGAALRRRRVDAAAADGCDGDHHRAPVSAAIADTGHGASHRRGDRLGRAEAGLLGARGSWQWRGARGEPTCRRGRVTLVDDNTNRRSRVQVWSRFDRRSVRQERGADHREPRAGTRSSR